MTHNIQCGSAGFLCTLFLGSTASAMDRLGGDCPRHTGRNHHRVVDIFHEQSLIASAEPRDASLARSVRYLKGE
jgi:hypothetical protein